MGPEGFEPPYVLALALIKPQAPIICTQNSNFVSFRTIHSCLFHTFLVLECVPLCNKNIKKCEWLGYYLRPHWGSLRCSPSPLSWLGTWQGRGPTPLTSQSLQAFGLLKVKSPLNICCKLTTMCGLCAPATICPHLPK